MFELIDLYKLFGRKRFTGQRNMTFFVSYWKIFQKGVIRLDSRGDNTNSDIERAERGTLGTLLGPEPKFPLQI